MNRDIEELRQFLEEMYPNAVLSHLGKKLLRVSEGLEKRVRELEQRFEEGEG